MIYNNVILEISKKNLISNFNYFNKLNKNNICAATIKSNAYGFGAENVYNILLKNGCRHFFVATTTEGVYLRKFFKKGIIYILNGLENNNLKLFKYYKLIPIISNLDDYEKIINKSINFGIQINTGINRLGLNYIDYKKISYDNKYLKIVLSHLSSADERKNIYNNTQLTKFNKIVKKYQNNKVIFSLANSFGSVLSNEYLFDMIRPGISIYGGHFNHSILKRKIKPVVKLKAKILQIKQIDKNEYVGYNQTFKTNKKTWIAIIGIGYGDGLKRILSNKGKVYLKNKKFDIIGRVSMDSIIVDIKSNKSMFQKEKYIEIINEKYGIDHLAYNCKTISHEVLTSLNNRVERKFV